MSIEAEIKEMKEDFQEHQRSDKEFFQLFSDDLKETKELTRALSDKILPVLDAFNGIKFGGKTGKMFLWTFGAVLGIIATILGIIAAVKNIWN